MHVSVIQIYCNKLKQSNGIESFIFVIKTYILMQIAYGQVNSALIVKLRSLNDQDCYLCSAGILLEYFSGYLEDLKNFRIRHHNALLIIA